MRKVLLLIISNVLFSSGVAQWQSANNGFYGGSIRTLSVDPTTNYLYATIGRGVYYQPKMAAVGHQ